MLKQIFPSLLIFSSIFWFGFDSDKLIRENHSANANPTATPTPDSANELVSIELDRDVVITPCPPGYRCLESGDNNMSIVVTISVAKSENKTLDYN